MKHFLDLKRQLPRRKNDETLGFRLSDPLNHGHSKRKGFAGSGLRNPDNIFSLNCDGNRFFLNGGWCRKLQTRDNIKKPWGNPNGSILLYVSKKDIDVVRI